MREFVNPNQKNNQNQNYQPNYQGYRQDPSSFSPALSQRERGSFKNPPRPSGEDVTPRDRRGFNRIGKIFGFLPRLFNSKKKLIVWAIIIALGVTAYFIWGRKEKQELAVYEALVNVVDQKASDPVEDARSSLKKGDVIAVFPEGHPWSDTEKYSYLIVKLKLTPDDMQKLTQAKTKEVKREKQKGENGEEIDMGPEQETILARQYYLDLPDYDVKKFWSSQSQPFADKIFDSSIVDKK